MALTPISALPDPPIRGTDTGQVFSDKTAALLAALQPWTDDVNDFGATLYAEAQSVISGVASVNGETGILVGYVKTTGAQTLADKTLAAPILDGALREEQAEIVGTTPAISPADGSIRYWTLTANSTPTKGTWHDGESLTLVATLANGSPLPAWLSFDATTRTFSGNPPDGAAGTVSVKLTAKDASGLEASDTFDIVIADTFKDLTTGADALSLTSLSETISGTSATYQVDDSIIDSSTTDNDVLNLTLITASPQAVVRGVENINVNWNALNFADFDAKFVSGATITISSIKVGYAGDVVVRNAGANKVVAGDGAKGELDVFGGTAVTVDAGSADKVQVVSSGVAARDLSVHITAGAGTVSVGVLGFKAIRIVDSAAITSTQATADAR